MSIFCTVKLEIVFFLFKGVFLLSLENTWNVSIYICLFFSKGKKMILYFLCSFVCNFNRKKIICVMKLLMLWKQQNQHILSVRCTSNVHWIINSIFNTVIKLLKVRLVFFLFFLFFFLSRKNLFIYLWGTFVFNYIINVYFPILKDFEE